MGECRRLARMDWGESSSCLAGWKIFPASPHPFQVTCSSLAAWWTLKRCLVNVCKIPKASRRPRWEG